MDWVGVVVGGDDPLLTGLRIGGRDLTETAGGVLDALDVPRVGSLAEAVAAAGAGRRGGVLVLDAHCPLVSVDDVARVRDAGAVAVGVRPVTDTVKLVQHTGDLDLLGETVDREALVQVAAPLAVPDAALLRGVDVADLPGLVVALRRRTTVELVEAGPGARRVRDASDLALIEADGPGAG